MQTEIKIMSLLKSILSCKECGHQIELTALKCPNCGSKKTTNVKWLSGLIILVIIIILFIKFTSSSHGSMLQKNVTLKYTLNTLIFGTSLTPDFTIKNLNHVPIKDITIECVELASNGSKIDSLKNTIFEVIQPQETKIFQKFDMGYIGNQTASITCDIVSVETL